MSDDDKCPTHGEDCPGHMHFEVTATEGPNTAIIDNVAYMWADTDTPAVLPAGNMDDMDGWKEIGYITEDQMDDMFKPPAPTPETVRVQAQHYTLTYQLMLKDEEHYRRWRYLLFGLMPHESDINYPLIDLDKVKWPCDACRVQEWFDGALKLRVEPWQLRAMIGHTCHRPHLPGDLLPWKRGHVSLDYGKKGR